MTTVAVVLNTSVHFVLRMLSGPTVSMSTLPDLPQLTFQTITTANRSAFLIHTMLSKPPEK